MRLSLLAAVVLVSAAFATFAAAPSTAPAATLASKQAQAAELDAQVRKLENRFDHLQERFRGAQIELDRIQSDVEDAHRVVLATRRDLGVAKVTLADRADAIYRSGGGEGLADLVSSAGSLDDFFDRIETRRRIGDQDATVLDTVEDLNARVEARERSLKRARSEAAAATRRAKVAKEQMGEVLSERQSKLANVNADIRSIMEAQRRAAAVRAAAAARESAALARIDEPSGTSSSAASDSGSPSSSSSSSSSLITVPLPPGSGTAAAAANAAMGKIGTPYQWAGSGPDTFDCSGLVMWAFAQAGRSGLPHSTYSLINMGVEVPLDQLQVGDLVFPSHIGHVGIYVGNNSFVHAPSSGDVVKVTSTSDYSISRARRL